ncbi:MAG: copper chaperone PCu(A)C [Candidatus Rokubacteria bacterium]|nr:copper chaperone PCu(A)C [Candidatus Rokubacteria bacterium]
MTRALALAVAVLVAAGCVHYPSVTEVGGTHIRPKRGRAVLQGDRAFFYVDLESTGKYGDVLTAVQTPLARQAILVGPSGLPVERVEVPGTTVVAFAPGAHHVVLAGFSRPLQKGEVIIVTLVFQKIGNLGVVTVVQ